MRIKVVEMTASHVLVVFHNSRAGRATLAQGVAAARQRGARLTVVCLAPTERPSRCCNQSTSLWNSEMRRVAAEDLEQAQSMLSGVNAEFLVREGQGRGAVQSTAADLGCDVILRPRAARLFGSGESLRSWFSRRLGGLSVAR